MSLKHHNNMVITDSSKEPTIEQKEISAHYNQVYGSCSCGIEVYCSPYSVTKPEKVSIYKGLGYCEASIPDSKSRTPRLIKCKNKAEFTFERVEDNPIKYLVCGDCLLKLKNRD